MAKQSAGFVHEHIEKVVIAVCAGFFVFAVYYGFASGRFNDANGTSPSELIKGVGDAADQAASAVLTAKPRISDADAAGTKDTEAVEALLAWYGSNAKSLGENAGVNMDVARAQAFPPLFVTTTSVSDADKRNIVKLVEPDLPVVAMGTSGLELTAERPLLENYDPARAPLNTKKSTLTWVAVAAQVNLQEQDLYFKTEKYPPNSYLSIVKVHLQRIDRDEKWRGWQDVETWLPFEPFDRMTAAQSKKLRELIEPNQEAIARPILPRTDGDRIEYDKILPFLDAPPKKGGSLDRLAKDWIDRANRAGKSKDFEAAMIFARAAMQAPDVPAKTKDEARSIYEKALARVEKRPGGYKAPSRLAPADKMMPIVAYDLTAVPGHEYQYRIRYEAWNQYAGRDAELKDPASASMTTIFSDFSPVTPPVRVESDVQFFLTDASEQRNKVEVTVWKRSRRKWEKQDYRLAVGEAIGKKDKGGTDFSTGAVIVDIRFNQAVNGRQETILVYVAPDGSLREAVLSVDKKLNEEQKNRA
ncbi:MAG: hypothetical protein H6819_01430 [Phycisphaerales bacterium]|nr:hypothetical protein [Phycisphaerales bacterium]MCB9857130.1 hypothetical protein [Phycisphaerales bacterium]MCB9861743.1 hypothetical protein [Phycisphaerales bacterium]